MISLVEGPSKTGPSKTGLSINSIEKILERKSERRLLLKCKRHGYPIKKRKIVLKG